MAPGSLPFYARVLDSGCEGDQGDSTLGARQVRNLNLCTLLPIGWTARQGRDPARSARMGLHRLDGMVPVSRPLGYGPDHESAESPCEEHRKTHRVTEIPSSSAMVSGVGFGSLREGYEMKRGAKGDVGWPPRCKHVRSCYRYRGKNTAITHIRSRRIPAWPEAMVLRVEPIIGSTKHTGDGR